MNGIYDKNNWGDQNGLCIYIDGYLSTRPSYFVIRSRCRLKLLPVYELDISSQYHRSQSNEQVSRRDEPPRTLNAENQ